MNPIATPQEAIDQMQKKITTGLSAEDEDFLFEEAREHDHNGFYRSWCDKALEYDYD